MIIKVQRRCGLCKKIINMLVCCLNKIARIVKALTFYIKNFFQFCGAGKFLSTRIRNNLSDLNIFLNKNCTVHEKPRKKCSQVVGLVLSIRIFLGKPRKVLVQSYYVQVHIEIYFFYFVLRKGQLRIRNNYLECRTRILSSATLLLMVMCIAV